MLDKDKKIENRLNFLKWLIENIKIESWSNWEEYNAKFPVEETQEENEEISSQT